MKELTQYILAVFAGVFITIIAKSFYETQRVEDIKSLYELEAQLSRKKSAKELEELILEVQKQIDSLETEK